MKRYQLHKKENWATLILHLSFILIIVGAFVTRYISYEGMMPIREGESANIVYSDKPYLTVLVDGEYKGEMKRKTFEKLRNKGAESIVSVHLSSELSGTYEAAVLASRRVDFPVDVVDSRGIAMMMGFAVLAGARLATAGSTQAEVVTAINRKCAGASILFYVDSLEFLERGGRINSMQARMGKAMDLKPLLHMINGKVEQRELVRSSEKALARMVDLVSAAARIKSEIAVHHVEAQDAAQEIANQLKSRTGVTDIEVTPAGAVVGTHVGPGSLAVVVSPQV